MKDYKQPELEIETFAVKDIITTSGDTDLGPDDGSIL